MKYSVLYSQFGFVVDTYKNGFEQNNIRLEYHLEPEYGTFSFHLCDMTVLYNVQVLGGSVRLVFDVSGFRHIERHKLASDVIMSPSKVGLYIIKSFIALLEDEMNLDKRKKVLKKVEKVDTILSMVGTSKASKESKLYKLTKALEKKKGLLFEELKEI